ncbi:RNA polymerase sigma factor [Caenimonas sedimenti]|uniref:RNA polymerase sigma factor n=1 Tax=Caenimonas sedimenti TaxID=2596921 RepID=A0A562ZFG7_9BURK|nr:RNA polymerase sigma factor [Caenimonas sedimenti]TWO66008.1 RNA polymerase sigma factor [Caenimonas sedimenti]
MSNAPLRAAPEPPDDAGLVERLRASDGGALETLMRRHNRRLYRVARAMLRNNADAEDALQEAYLSAYRSIHEFRSQASLATWLTRIVVNECTSRLRRQARRDNIVPIVAAAAQLPEEVDAMVDERSHIDAETPDRALLRSEMRELLERKIDALPEDFRTVLVMRSIEELSVEETAASLGVPEATVRTRHFRARSMLRESIAQELDTAERDVFAFDGERCDRIVAELLRRRESPLP